MSSLLGSYYAWSNMFILVGKKFKFLDDAQNPLGPRFVLSFLEAGIEQRFNHGMRGMQITWVDPSGEPGSAKLAQGVWASLTDHLQEVKLIIKMRGYGTMLVKDEDDRPLLRRGVLSRYVVDPNEALKTGGLRKLALGESTPNSILDNRSNEINVNVVQAA